MVCPYSFGEHALIVRGWRSGRFAPGVRPNWSESPLLRGSTSRVTNGPNEKVIVVRADTYAALKRLRIDSSYRTFDALIREALIAKYGPSIDLTT